MARAVVAKKQKSLTRQRQACLSALAESAKDGAAEKI
jgi:hypothetical protein